MDGGKEEKRELNERSTKAVSLCPREPPQLQV